MNAAQQELLAMRLVMERAFHALAGVPRAKVNSPFGKLDTEETAREVHQILEISRDTGEWLKKFR